jgi:hypothetical protein
LWLLSQDVTTRKEYVRPVVDSGPLTTATTSSPISTGMVASPVGDLPVNVTSMDFSPGPFRAAGASAGGIRVILVGRFPQTPRPPP